MDIELEIPETNTEKFIPAVAENIDKFLNAMLDLITEPGHEKANAETAFAVMLMTHGIALRTSNEIEGMMIEGGYPQTMIDLMRHSIDALLDDKGATAVTLASEIQTMREEVFGER